MDLRKSVVYAIWKYKWTWPADVAYIQAIASRPRPLLLLDQVYIGREPWTHFPSCLTLLQRYWILIRAWQLPWFFCMPQKITKFDFISAFPETYILWACFVLELTEGFVGAWRGRPGVCHEADPRPVAETCRPTDANRRQLIDGVIESIVEREDTFWRQYSGEWTWRKCRHFLWGNCWASCWDKPVLGCACE